MLAISKRNDFKTPDLSARFDTLKMASTQDKLLGTFYVKEIQKQFECLTVGVLPL